MPIDLTTTDVLDLRADTIDVTPIEHDWSQSRLDAEPYFAEAFTYDTAEDSTTLIAEGSSVTHVVLDDGTHWPLQDWDAYRIEIADDEGNLPDGAFTEADFEALSEVPPYEWGAEGPMMNYWYPVTIDDTVWAAARIADLPLCVVQMDGTTGLALTGGGMDLSWEICEAFVALGHLPPVHFTLPAMAMPLTPTRAFVGEAMRRSITVRHQRCEHDLTRLDRTLEFLRQYH